MLRCEECGAEAKDDAAGWKAYLTLDDEAVVCCPKCAEREFGEASESERSLEFRPPST